MCATFTFTLTPDRVPPNSVQAKRDRCSQPPPIASPPQARMHTLACKAGATKEPSHTAPDIGNVSQHVVNLRREGASISTDTQKRKQGGEGRRGKASIITCFVIYLPSYGSRKKNPLHPHVSTGHSHSWVRTTGSGHPSRHLVNQPSHS